MRNYMVLFLLVIFNTSIFAQKELVEKANVITNKMTKALNLNEKQRSKVFDIQLKRFKEVDSIQGKYEKGSEIRKAELKKVYNKLYGKLKGNLGEEKMKLWNQYKRNN